MNSSGLDTGSEHSARDSCDIEEGLHVTLDGSEKITTNTSKCQCTIQSTDRRGPTPLLPASK